MKVLFKNTGYFLKEIITIIKIDLLSNIFSIFSLSFIFFMLSLIISGGWISTYMISAIENEAEISVYYKENETKSDVKNMVVKIAEIEGVKSVVAINGEEAQEKMLEIMGKESRIIQLFDHNPFSPYIEVKIELSNMEMMTNAIEEIDGVDFVRDNKDVLNKLVNISNLANILGILIIAAVSIVTLITTSHIIRQGIYNNREQINTLRLLGSPEYFITLPFILEGIFMTIIAGLLSLFMVATMDKYIYSQVSGSLPFLILPPLNELIIGIGLFSLVLSLVLGFVGSMLGLKATKRLK